MSPAFWERAKSAYFDAIVLSEAERASYVAAVSKHDAELARFVVELLDSEADEELHLEGPCWDVQGAGAELTAAGLLEPGQCLAGRFEITNCLGAGGAGEVYRAFDRIQKEFVAVKVLRPELAPDREARRLLRNEAHTARLVSHANVCRLHEFYANESEGRPFLTMELVIGETLQARLKRQERFTVEEAAPVVAQMLDGLEAMHREKVLHRDFKTSNIMLSEGGRTVLMDFGLARDIQAGRDIAQTISMNRLAGTVAYMAPEQLRGAAATAAADIHAFGVVLFEMLTGERPFDGATALETASRRLQEKAPAPEWKGRPVHPAWAYVIERCLEVEPGKRPETVEEIRGLLRRGPPLLWKRRQVLAAAAVGALGVSLAALSVRSFGKREPVAREAALGPYMRGSKLLEEFSAAAARSAVHHFEEALRADPSFELAMAALTEAHIFLVKTESAKAREHEAEAEKWAELAVRTNPNVAQTHLAMATVKQAKWRWKEAETAYLKALELGPGLAKAHRWYAGLLLQFGRAEEGLRHARRAWELDREDRSMPASIGFYNFVAGRLTEALGYLEPAVEELDSVSRSDSSRFNLAQVYACLGVVSQGQDARQYFEKALRQAAIVKAFEDRAGDNRHLLSDQLFAHIHAMRGEREAAEPYVKRLEKHYADGVAPALYMGSVYAALDRRREAIAVFAKGVAKHDPTMLYVKVIPFLSDLRKEPEFQKLIQEMSL